VTASNILLLGLVSLLNDFSSEMIRPVLPLFLEALGSGIFAIATAGGLMDSVSSVLKVFSGYWSDRSGARKPLVYCGYLCSAGFKLLLGLAGGVQQAVVFSALERVGKGLRTAPRDALIAESMPQRHGRAFGIHRAFDTAGAILGSVAALCLLVFFGLSLKTVIIAAAVMALASLVPLRFVVETRRNGAASVERPTVGRMTGPLKLFIAVAGLFALGNFSYMFFLVRARRCFGEAAAPAAVVGLYVIFNIFYAAFSVPLGVLSDRIGKLKVVAAGYLLFAVASLGFAFAEGLWGLVGLFAVYGLSYAAVDANQRAVVSDLTGPEGRATALGLFHTVTGLAALAASLVAACLWHFVGWRASFAYGAIVGSVSALLVVLGGQSGGLSGLWKVPAEGLGGPQDGEKNGEVVGPAGGETGLPRCLAEDRKPPTAAYFQFSRASISVPTRTAPASDERNYEECIFQAPSL